LDQQCSKLNTMIWLKILDLMGSLKVLYQSISYYEIFKIMKEFFTANHIRYLSWRGNNDLIRVKITDTCHRMKLRRDKIDQVCFSVKLEQIAYEKFFSRWWNATCYIPPTQEKSACPMVSFFCFMGQKLRDIPKRHAEFVPGTKVRFHFYW